MYFLTQKQCKQVKMMLFMLFVGLCFSTSICHAQPTILNQAKNIGTELQDYFNQKLASDITQAKSSLEFITGLDLSSSFDHLTFLIEDVEDCEKNSSFEEGEYDYQKHLIHLCPRKEDQSSRVRFVISHELGHWGAYEFFSRHSPTYIQMKTLRANLNPNNPNPNVMHEIDQTLDLFNPLSELFADVFRTIYLKHPGESGMRSFAEIPEGPTTIWKAVTEKNLHKEAKDHQIYNPTRRALWEKVLRDNLNDNTTLIIAGQKVLQATVRQLEDLKVAQQKGQRPLAVSIASIFDHAKAEVIQVAILNQAMVSSLSQAGI